MSAQLKPASRVIRRMQHDDLVEVMQIENQAYEFPWTLGIFKDCVRVGYQCMVLLENEHIIAHAVLSIGAGESHLLNLSVRPHYQNQGVGRYFLDYLIRAASLEAHTLLLEVRPSNKAAVYLYEDMGFNEVGVRPNYYPARKGREDALVMAMELHAV